MRLRAMLQAGEVKDVRGKMRMEGTMVVVVVVVVVVIVVESKRQGEAAKMIFGASMRFLLGAPATARGCAQRKKQARAPPSHTHPASPAWEFWKKRKTTARQATAVGSEDQKRKIKGDCSTHNVRCVLVSAFWETGNEVRNFANANA